MESSLSSIHALSQLLAYEVPLTLRPRPRPRPRLTAAACFEVLRVCEYHVTTSLATLYVQQVSHVLATHESSMCIMVG